MPITEAGVRLNVDVGLRYLEAWLGGTGAAAIHNLMEDAATAEISRAQLWQWVHHGVSATDGSRIDRATVAQLIDDGMVAIEAEKASDVRRRAASRTPAKSSNTSPSRTTSTTSSPCPPTNSSTDRPAELNRKATAI